MKVIEINKTCVVCSKEYTPKTNNSKFCDKTCWNENRRLKKYNNNSREGYDYIICYWDNKPVGKYMSQYIEKYFPERTYQEYCDEFPDQPRIAPSYQDKISKNSGKHMSDPYYRQMFSEMFKGDNNPNSKKNTTLLQRQICSKYSKEYWKKNHPELNESEIKIKVSEFAKESQKNRLTETQLQYWIDKCNGNIDEAKILLKDRQITFSLEKCIKKYGEIQGTRKWKERNIKWSEKIEAKYKNGEFDKMPKKFNSSMHSKNSIQLIDSIISLLDMPLDLIKCYKNKELIIRDNNMIIKSFDFTYLPTKKIIEFNGDYWHCNPEIYESTYYHKTKKMTAQEIWDYDAEKKALAESHGYQVLHITELEYKKDPDKVLKKCIEFINE